MSVVKSEESEKPATSRGPLGTRHLLHHEAPIFELGAAGRSGASLPELDVPEEVLRAREKALRETYGLPDHQYQGITNPSGDSADDPAEQDPSEDSSQQ